jgi:CheY-like chemotaxis protein
MAKGASSLRPVPDSPLTTILVAADAEWVRAQVRAALVGRGQRVVEVASGFDVRPAIAADPPDLVVLDLQIGNMGGIAVALDLHLEEGAGRLPHIPILLLLDRAADRFLARRAAVDAELVKPVDAGTLRRTAKRLLTATAIGAPRPEPTTSARIQS